MKWKACPFEGWHTGFAWLPTTLTTGMVIWMEPYRYYVNRFGVIASIIGTPDV